MPLSDQMRKLAQQWDTGNRWPRFLDWLEIRKIRGWSGQRVAFRFPIVAIVGENGSGKSTVLQAAACAYRAPERHATATTWFPTEFFPETAWDTLRDVRITFGVKQGEQHLEVSMRKPTSRWLGGPQRPERAVEYIDLSRLQPVATRVGYARIAKTRHSEDSAEEFDAEQVARLSQIMGRDYDGARMAISDIDATREIPVLSKESRLYSGFHQGSGETTVAELLKTSLPRHGLVLIDEIESSLHPRAQRRLVRDLAHAARLNECQIILTTHSPYVLEELPLRARTYILESLAGKSIATGVSPQFAMSKMDDEMHPECELYVEDTRAQVWLREILSRHAPELAIRCSIVPFGAASVGVALGQMAADERFPRPTVVFLDGDQDESRGCFVLPGGDAPERVVMRDLQLRAWGDLWTRIGRDTSQVADALARAMTFESHKEWIRAAANELLCGGDVLWQALCAEWAERADPEVVRPVIEAVEDTLAG